MPNWCNNILKLKHKDPAAIERAVRALGNESFCEEFIPTPAELKATSSPNRDEEQAAALVEKYGYSDWYSFQVSEWGTKWDFGGEVTKLTKKTVTMSFDTAWSPPISVMAKLEELGYDVQLDYYEPGMCFVGRYVDGEDYYYETDQPIPADIDELWGISENAELDEEE